MHKLKIFAATIIFKICTLACLEDLMESDCSILDLQHLDSSDNNISGTGSQNEKKVSGELT